MGMYAFCRETMTKRLDKRADKLDILRAKARAVVAVAGLNATAHRIGIAPRTLRMFLLDVQVQPGTIAIIRQCLDKRGAPT
jgi:hypothetical protein